jgi:SAM-dependent methyltransferase
MHTTTSSQSTAPAEATPSPALQAMLRAGNGHDATLFEREADHHDEWADQVDVDHTDLLAAWNGLGCPELAWIREQLGDVRGLKVLDLGSGLGEASIWFALQGAEVTALDISSGMLEVVRQFATRYGVAVSTFHGSATDLSDFSSETFDIVYGANVLHHVDIATCVGEASRVLRPGGRAVFWDPVKYNPAIEIYRRLASGVRTDDEHPLRRSDLRTITSTFDTVRAQGFWLIALSLFFRFFIIDRIHPSADRYWKLAIERQDQHRRFLHIAHKADRLLLRVCPPLRWVCWNIAFVGVKR